MPQWETEQPGVVWADVPDAPEPAATAPLRLVQMRRIAGQHAARLTSNVGNEKPGDLRLLTKPLYRYPADVTGAIDGGLFAFVQGTDPEVLLLLEAVQSTDGPRWRMAFAIHKHDGSRPARRPDGLGMRPGQTLRRRQSLLRVLEDPAGRAGIAVK